MTDTSDAHGQAALMLCEGLALLLVARGLLTSTEVVDTIDGIVDVRQEIAASSRAGVVDVSAIMLLQTISRSMSAASRQAVPSAG